MGHGPQKAETMTEGERSGSLQRLLGKGSEPANPRGQRDNSHWPLAFIFGIPSTYRYDK